MNCQSARSDGFEKENCSSTSSWKNKMKRTSRESHTSRDVEVCNLGSSIGKLNLALKIVGLSNQSSTATNFGKFSSLKWKKFLERSNYQLPLRSSDHRSQNCANCLDQNCLHCNLQMHLSVTNLESPTDRWLVNGREFTFPHENAILRTIVLQLLVCAG